MKMVCAPITWGMFGLLINTIVFAASGSPQQAKVQNVQFIMYGYEVVINYDLLGDPSVKYNVRLMLRRGGDPSYEYFPKSLSGDIGTGRFVGEKKQIIWAIDYEFPKGLQGNDYYFVVQAENIEKKSDSQILTWIGSGVAVLAAAVTYVIILNNKPASANTTNSGFTIPPPRP